MSIGNTRNDPRQKALSVALSLAGYDPDLKRPLRRVHDIAEACHELSDEAWLSNPRAKRADDFAEDAIVALENLASIFRTARRICRPFPPSVTEKIAATRAAREAT